MATASYPSSIVDFGPDHVDYVDTIYAAHPNAIQAEVAAIETTIGVSPTTSTSPSSSGSWVPGFAAPTIAARLANIEQGLVGDSHTQYIKTTGGSVTGNVTFSGGAKVTGLPSPSASTDAATKSYVDSAVGSTAAPVRLDAVMLFMGA